VTPACHADPPTERRTFVVLPSSVGRWLADQGRAVPPGPSFAPGCDPTDAGRPPKIVTPAAGQVVLLLPGLPASRQRVPFQVETRAPEVSWFVDGALVGTVPATTRLFWPPVAGRHVVVVADDAGRKDRRTLEVRVR
jgi:penicillin-binding protein 1C